MSTPLRLPGALPEDTVEATRLIREMYPPGAYPLAKYGVPPRPEASQGPRAQTVLVDPNPEDATTGGQIVDLTAAADLRLANQLHALPDAASRMETLARVAPGQVLDHTPATRVNPKFGGYAVPSAKFEGTLMPDGMRVGFGPGRDEAVTADPDWVPPVAPPPPPARPAAPVAAQPAPAVNGHAAAPAADPVEQLMQLLGGILQQRVAQPAAPPVQPAAAPPQPASEPWGGVAPSPPGVDPEVLKAAEREGAQKLWESLGLSDAEYHPTPAALEPKWQAVFVGSMGQQTGWYHRVYNQGEHLILVYDTRFRFGSQYLPPMAEEGMPLKITFANAAGSPSYAVLYEGLHFALGCFDLLLLRLVPQAALPPVQAEEPQLVPPPHHPSQQNLINVLGGAGLS